MDKAGATTLPARRVFNIIRELPSSEIQIDVDGKNAASIRSGQSFFKILGLPEDEFPPLPKFEDAKVVTMRQKDLRDGLRKTSYAISTDETRYVLNGVLFSFKDNKLTLVATDGRRLAMAEIELEFPRSHESDLIVPTKAVTELQRLLTDDGDVKVSMSNGQIRTRRRLSCTAPTTEAITSAQYDRRSAMATGTNIGGETRQRAATRYAGATPATRLIFRSLIAR